MARSRRGHTRWSASRWEPFDGGFPPYIPVAVRKQEAAAAVASLRKKGVNAAPVQLAGRRIATTFWGKAWCDNLERYSDFANRLPRGRSYVRSGSVIDLRIERGEVTALVQGSSLYDVHIAVTPVTAAQWKAIVHACTGKIDSVVELLAGKLSEAVMEVITRRETGLFPAPAHIRMSCSCPDYATMCKHVAAVLYGVGARLDVQPDLLFELRAAAAQDLISAAAAGGLVRGKGAVAEKVLESSSLSSVFGIDLETDTPPAPRRAAAHKRSEPAAPLEQPPSTTRRSPSKRATPASPSEQLPSTTRRSPSKRAVPASPSEQLPSTTRRSPSKRATPASPSEQLPSTTRRSPSKRATPASPSEQLPSTTRARGKGVSAVAPGGSRASARAPAPRREAATPASAPYSAAQTTTAPAAAGRPRKRAGR